MVARHLWVGFGEAGGDGSVGAVGGRVGGGAEAGVEGVVQGKGLDGVRGGDGGVVEGLEELGAPGGGCEEGEVGNVESRDGGEGRGGDVDLIVDVEGGVGEDLIGDLAGGGCGGGVGGDGVAEYFLLGGLEDFVGGVRQVSTGGVCGRTEIENHGVVEVVVVGGFIDYDIL